MNLHQLAASGETMYEALGRESYLTGAGLKELPEFQAIFDRHAELTGDEALETARASGLRELLEWLVDVRVGRKTARLDERQIRWEQQAVVRVDGREVPYLRAPIDLANTSDRSLRGALDNERSRVGAEGLNGICLERFGLEREEVARLGLGDYVEARSALSGIALDALGASAEEFLRATGDLYQDGLARVARARLGIGVGELTHADIAWAFRADRFDAAFQPGTLTDLAVRQMRDLGLDATQGGRVRFDTDERQGKQPRAFCAPVRVPHEVYLVLRPRGGHADYRTFWHELGHALHFASVNPGLPFAARWLGDNSVTEGFAMLWDHMTMERAWLRRYAALSDADARALGFELAVGELFLVRRYAAKLAYELRLHRADPGTMGPEYATRLSAATRFRYTEDGALLDVDPGFYAARYLRAWQLEASLATDLTERFDEDWYRNPRAGVFLQHLMSQGQAQPAEALARDVMGAGAELSFGTLARRLEALLD